MVHFRLAAITNFYRCRRLVKMFSPSRPWLICRIMEVIHLHYNFQTFLSSQLVPWFIVEAESNEAVRASSETKWRNCQDRSEWAQLNAHLETYFRALIIEKSAYFSDINASMPNSHHSYIWWGISFTKMLEEVRIWNNGWFIINHSLQRNLTRLSLTCNSVLRKS